VSKRLPSADEAIKILRENGCSPRVIGHCKAVSELAVRIAKKCEKNGIKVDIELIRVGALLHDIGRSKTHSVHHVAVGAEIARSLGLPASVIAIIERHAGGGITVEEASRLGWPEKSYVPETLEEKIVSYADKLIEEAKTVPVEKTIQKLREELGADHPAIKRVMDLHKEISSICKNLED
jgi:uncharacterized protein